MTDSDTGADDNTRNVIYDIIYHHLADESLFLYYFGSKP